MARSAGPAIATGTGDRRKRKFRNASAEQFSLGNGSASLNDSKIEGLIAKWHPNMTAPEESFGRPFNKVRISIICMASRDAGSIALGKRVIAIVSVKALRDLRDTSQCYTESCKA